MITNTRSKTPPGSRRTVRISTLSALGALALVVSSCAPTTTTSAMGDEIGLGADGWYGLSVGEPMSMPDVILTDTSGEQFDLRAQTDGQPTLLFFGYTSCPDICPVHLSVLAGAMEEALVTSDELAVVFVSADPARDTPEALRTYLDTFDPGFIGLTGDIETVNRAIDDLGLPQPTYSEPDDEGNYTVGHPAAIVAFDGGGSAHHLYPFGIRRAHWVHDMPMITGDESR